MARMNGYLPVNACGRRLAAWSTPLAALALAAGCRLASPVTKCETNADCPSRYRCDLAKHYCVGIESQPWSVRFLAPAAPMYTISSWYLFVWDPGQSYGTLLRPDTPFRVEKFATADCSGTPLSEELLPLPHSLFGGMQPGASYSIRVTAYEADGTPSLGACSPTITSGDKLALGYQFSCDLHTDGALRCWGSNEFSQLGVAGGGILGDSPDELGSALPPIELGTDFSPIDVVTGMSHTCALSTGGAVKCWGNNENGQLGLGDTNSRGAAMGDALPVVDLGTARPLSMAAAGGRNTCGLIGDGEVKCWGYNTSGQLGLGDTTSRGNDADTAVNDVPYIDFGAGRSAAVIATFSSHACAILDDLSLKCWGSNSNGRLGLGDTANRGDASGKMGDSLPAIELGTRRRVLSVVGGSRHTCALLDHGDVKCWGYNNLGQLGYGDTLSRGDGTGAMGDALPTVDLGLGRSAIAIAAGSYFNCALLDNATVKCWGDNGYGQIGQGDQDARGDERDEMGDSLPPVDLGADAEVAGIAAGLRHCCALLMDGSIKCWGNNSYGQIGHEANLIGDQQGEMGDALGAVELGGSWQPSGLFGGPGNGFCARSAQATKCWGNFSFNSYYGDNPNEMGDSLPEIALGAGLVSTVIEIGSSHTCAMLNNGSSHLVKCWGSNDYGQLGYGDTLNRRDPSQLGDDLPAVNLGVSLTPTHLGVGSGFSCARLDTGTVKCWGRNNYGQLGVGDRDYRGNDQGEMGEALPTVDLGTGAFAQSVVVGIAHACALLQDGQVKCWGNNNSGQLGIGDTDSRGDDPGEMGELLPSVSLSTTHYATALAAGAFHNCALLDDQTVKCWGRNDLGLLGTGDLQIRGDQLDDMGDNLPAVDLGNGATVRAIDCGVYHCCAVLTDGRIKCWGANDVGQLGLGDHQNRGDNPGEMDGALPAVSLPTGDEVLDIALSNQATCALIANSGTDLVRCWGNNFYGELGTGELNSMGDDPEEMGDALPAVDLGSP
ncbi:MAG: hypothetical protein JXR83_20165 [Deltaproteobacteria bacterium]|nr:hypothetical protein [Deltaproteobacteria bacterium]